MIDWTRSMQQTYEFYAVDPDSWGDKELITTIESCSIKRDADTDTLGSASFSCSDNLPEQYVRVYLVVKQDDIKDRICLGTFLIQTPGDRFDGKKHNISLDGYTPLIELKNDYPSLGYTILKDTPIMDTVYQLCVEHMRAPVLAAKSDKNLYQHYVGNARDTWFSFINDLMANAEYHFGVEPDGRVIFEPYIELSSMRPVWTFDDGNSSILMPEIDNDSDLYDVPNVVEVIYSTDNQIYRSEVVNDDPNSITSTVSRGRIVKHRDTSPSLAQDMTGANAQEYLDAYAEKLLRDLSNIEHTLTYSHGYCPVRVGDCVLLNYEKAGIRNVRAKVTGQQIDCTTGCTVSETAVYTTQLWR